MLWIARVRQAGAPAPAISQIISPKSAEFLRQLCDVGATGGSKDATSAQPHDGGDAEAVA